MDKDSIAIGIASCTASSLVISLGMAVLVVMEKHSYSESIVELFFSSWALWSLLGVVFSLAGSIIIGTPTAITLDYFGRFRWYTVLPVGVTSGVMLRWWLFGSTSNHYIAAVTGIYGGCGALAFWLGVCSNKQVKRDAQQAERPLP